MFEYSFEKLEVWKESVDLVKSINYFKGITIFLRRRVYSAKKEDFKNN